MTRLALRDEQGASLVELGAAMAIMVIAVLGIAGMLSLGSSVAGHSRQRTYAASVAAERLERVRNLPFDQVALYEAPAHSSDPDHPDADVTADGTAYAVAGGPEALVVSASGAVRHVEDPITRGTTELYVYQYVTWVDDPAIAGAQDYKRLTAVVSWRRALNRGPSSRLVVSSFVGPGRIDVAQATPVPSAGTATPTPAPTATPAPGCDGDTTAPTLTLSVLSGAGAAAGYTSSPTVQAEVLAMDSCASLGIELSNDGTTWTSAGSATSGLKSTQTWTLPAVDGPHQISARVVDSAGNVSEVATAQITLDMTPPTVPGTLATSTCTISGTSRTATLTWNPSTDANLAGYRLYRSVEAQPFTVVATSSTTSATDVSLKTADTVRYVARAYDKAGHESGDTNVLAYPKNSC